VTVECTHERVERGEHPTYSAGGEPWIDLISMRVTLEGDLDDVQRDRIAYIAGRCPVYRTLKNAPMIAEEVTLTP
jgi:putative redox protein